MHEMEVLSRSLAGLDLRTRTQSRAVALPMHLRALQYLTLVVDTATGEATTGIVADGTVYAPAHALSSPNTGRVVMGYGGLTSTAMSVTLYTAGNGEVLNAARINCHPASALPGLPIAELAPAPGDRVELLRYNRAPVAGSVGPGGNVGFFETFAEAADVGGFGYSGIIVRCRAAARTGMEACGLFTGSVTDDVPAGGKPTKPRQVVWFADMAAATPRAAVPADFDELVRAHGGKRRAAGGRGSARKRTQLGLGRMGAGGTGKGSGAGVGRGDGAGDGGGAGGRGPGGDLFLGNHNEAVCGVNPDTGGLTLHAHGDNHPSLSRETGLQVIHSQTASNAAGVWVGINNTHITGVPVSTGNLFHYCSCSACSNPARNRWRADRHGRQCERPSNARSCRLDYEGTAMNGSHCNFQIQRDGTKKRPSGPSTLAGVFVPKKLLLAVQESTSYRQRVERARRLTNMVRFALCQSYFSRGPPDAHGAIVQTMYRVGGAFNDVTAVPV